jgi:hypothetical protein
MTRPGIQICLGIVLGTLVFVLHKESDRGSESYTMFKAGLEVNQILFVSLRNE